MRVYNDELYHYGVKGMKRRVKSQPIMGELQDQYHMLRFNPEVQPVNNQYHMLRLNPEVKPANNQYHTLQNNLKDNQLRKTAKPTVKPTVKFKDKQLIENHKNSGKEILSKMMIN